MALDDHALRHHLQRALVRGAQQAALGLVSHLQQRVAISARVSGGRGRFIKGGGGKRARPRRSYRYEASAPGEPPRKRTGTLQKSITADVSEVGFDVVIRVGSKVPYAPHLEFGTVRMRARPWLRSGIAEYQARFHAIVLAPVKAILKS